MNYTKYVTIFIIMIFIQLALFIYSLFAVVNNTFEYANLLMVTTILTMIWLPSLIVFLIIKLTSTQNYSLECNLSKIDSSINKYLKSGKFIDKSAEVDNNFKVFERKTGKENGAITRLFILNVEDIYDEKGKTNNYLLKIYDYLYEEIKKCNCYNDKLICSKNFILIKTDTYNNDLLKEIINKIYIKARNYTKYPNIVIPTDCILPFSISEKENIISFGKSKKELLAYENLKKQILDSFYE